MLSSLYIMPFDLQWNYDYWFYRLSYLTANLIELK